MISIVLPTYKEAQNLPHVTKAIADALAGRDWRYEILFVDDDSQDGSEEICAKLAESYPVRILVRKGERGLATAVIGGIEVVAGDVVVVMDADLSHPASAIPEMVERLQTGQSMDLMPNFGWVGSFLYKSCQLYTIDSPIPVWRINGTRWDKLDGWTLWAVVRGKRSFRSKKRDIVLRGYQLPTKSITRQIEKIYRTTDVIAVRTGDSVRIDVAAIPKKKQGEVREALKRRLTP